MSSFCAQKKNKETGGPISSYPDDAYRSCIGRNDGSDTYGIRGGKKKLVMAKLVGLSDRMRESMSTTK